MKRVFFLAFILSCLLGQSTFSQDSKTLTKINKKVKLEFNLDQHGVPSYSVFFEGRPVIQPSRLGFKLSNAGNLDSNFVVIKTASKSVDEAWKPVLGEVSSINNRYQQLTVQLKEQSETGRLLNIVFKVYEEGVGFRYEFPVQPNLKFFIVSDELTEFNLTGNHKAFWIPGDFDSNEYLYTTSTIL